MSAIVGLSLFGFSFSSLAVILLFVADEAALSSFAFDLASFDLSSFAVDLLVDEVEVDLSSFAVDLSSFAAGLLDEAWRKFSSFSAALSAATLTCERILLIVASGTPAFERSSIDL